MTNANGIKPLLLMTQINIPDSDPSSFPIDKLGNKRVPSSHDPISGAIFLPVTRGDQNKSTCFSPSTKITMLLLLAFLAQVFMPNEKVGIFELRSIFAHIVLT